MKHLDLSQLRILSLSAYGLRGSDSSTTASPPYYYPNSLTMKSSIAGIIIIRSSFSCEAKTA